MSSRTAKKFGELAGKYLVGSEGVKSTAIGLGTLRMVQAVTGQPMNLLTEDQKLNDPPNDVHSPNDIGLAKDYREYRETLEKVSPMVVLLGYRDAYFSP